MVDNDDVNLFGKNIITIKENKEALLVTCKETGTEVNAEESKYMLCHVNRKYKQLQHDSN
jgi:hypothetical protein